MPGQFFCCDGSGKNAMRLNFSTTGEEDIARCIPILGEMIKQYMKNDLTQISDAALLLRKISVIPERA